MKKSILFVTFVLLISGLGYARGNNQTQTIEKAFIKGFEVALVKQKQIVSQAQQDKFARYMEDITKQLKTKHPNATKVLNLGKLPSEFHATEKYNESAKVHYLWEVKEGDLESFYYDVQISHVLRATSDVIPSHVSSIAISIREIKAKELVEKLHVLKK